MYIHIYIYIHDPTPDSAVQVANISLLSKAAGRHAQRPFSLVLQRSTTVASTRGSTLPLDPPRIYIGAVAKRLRRAWQGRPRRAHCRVGGRLGQRCGRVAEPARTGVGAGRPAQGRLFLVSRRIYPRGFTECISAVI